MKCSMMLHFIWVFTVCNSTCLGVSLIQMLWFLTSVKTRRRGTTSVDELDKGEPGRVDEQQVDLGEPAAKKFKESDDVKAGTDSPKLASAMKPQGKLLLSFYIKHFLAHLSHWLMVSYCDSWMSVVRRPSSTIALKDISS